MITFQDRGDDLRVKTAYGERSIPLVRWTETEVVLAGKGWSSLGGYYG
ncbi:MAG: hypothetical protein V4702_00775 [Patescibacteria group bacterium]